MAGVLIIGQGIAGTCLAWELQRRNMDFSIVDRPLGETASRVAAGLVNPLASRSFRIGWRQNECLTTLERFYLETERELHGSWWQKTPIFRELESDDQLEIWENRQKDPATSIYAGPLFSWPKGWNGVGKAAYTRGSGVLHVEKFVNAARSLWASEGRFLEAEVLPESIELAPGGWSWSGKTYNQVVWCTGWEAFSHPAMAPVKERPSKGTIVDLKLPNFDWHAGILHFSHWLVYRDGCWRLGSTYAWSWDDPGVAEVSAIQELLSGVRKRYSGDLEYIGARAAVRPIIQGRGSQPIAGPIPGLEGQYIFSGLGSKGVTSAPWVAQQLAACLAEQIPVPRDLDPAIFWK